jgi:hypothetical protein
MRNLAVSALAALSLAACATAPVPNARPLNAEQIAAMGPTPVVLVEENNGVGKTWFAQDSSAAGASYGLIGALVSATMDAIMNSFPARRATKVADEVAEVMPVDAINASLAEQFRRQIAATPAGQGISFSEVNTVQRLTAPTPQNDAVEIDASYMLSEDATTLQVVVSLTYTNPDIPYVTPYTFEGSTPKSELSGPTYRNTFTYNSRQLPAPVMTPELRERLIASIQDSARDENGALPAEGTDAFKAMTKELDQARDDDFTKGEIGIFLAREWIRDNGALLRAEIEGAHAFIARYALLDMNRTAVPSLTGQDELVETLADGRTVRRIGAGTIAGSYVSSPAEVMGFTTYGNTMSIARVHSDRMAAIREAARPARRAR